jgi:hypothetical protein
MESDVLKVVIDMLMYFVRNLSHIILPFIPVISWNIRNDL